MGTLLLRLASPMQSWGDESKYDIRGTRREPTKSGVIGLISAAMGLRRDSQEIIKLSETLRMGVRVDQPGTIVSDFHTARAPKYSSNGSLRYAEDGSIVMEASPYVTKRYYICDAVFLVGLECQDEELLKGIELALCSPVFSLFLGRRSCPATLPINLGIKASDLITALNETPWIASEWYKDRNKSIRARIITETRQEDRAWYLQMDQPVSFSPIYRRYSMRGIDREQYVILGMPVHDPMAVL